MINNKLHTPEGVKDYLPEEFNSKIQIQNCIENVFIKYGYRPINSPTLEYMETFKDKGSLNDKQMFKFLDRDGSLLTLRPDMTPAIARIAATAFEKGDIPLRFCYTENTFRYNENYQGKLREFTQSGVELIGINSNDADAEVVAVAINSLLATGLDKFRVDIGEVRFFEGVLEEAEFSKEDCKIIYDYIIAKEYTAVDKFISRSDAKENIKELFFNLPFLIGGEEVLDKAEKFVSNEKSIVAINELKNIYSILEGYKLEGYVNFDLSLIGQFDYYTGIIFSAYTKGTGFSVINGGRYDKLVVNYGEDYPAVGFAIKVNDLMAALSAKGVNYPCEIADTLAAYSKKGRGTALTVADELRSKGLNVENSLVGETIDKNIEYAKKRKMGGVLYFEDENKVRIINVSDNTEKTLDIAELLKGEVQ